MRELTNRVLLQLTLFLFLSVQTALSASSVSILADRTKIQTRIDEPKFTAQQQFLSGQSNKEFIENFDSDTEILTVRSENFFEGQFTGIILVPGAEEEIRM